METIISRLPIEVVQSHIIPYTYRPQPKKLLQDIQSFYDTWNCMKKSYLNILIKWDESYNLYGKWPEIYSYPLIKRHIQDNLKPRINDNIGILNAHMDLSWCKIWCRIVWARMDITMRQYWVIFKERFIAFPQKNVPVSHYLDYSLIS